MNSIDQFHNPVIVTDHQLMITEWNHGAVKAFGLKKVEVLGKSISLIFSGNVIHPDLSHKSGQLNQSGHKEIRQTLQRRTGELFPAHLSCSIFRGTEECDASLLIHVIELNRAPITLNEGEDSEQRYRSLFELFRKQNEEKLRASELRMLQQKRLLDQILDHLPVALFSKDINNDFRYVMCNRKYEELFGVLAEDTIGRTDFELSNQSSARNFRDEDELLARNNQILDIPEEYFVSPSGDHLFIHTIKLAIPDAHGRPSQILGICEDITERRETERALQASERRFRDLAANAPVGIFLTDPRGACIYVNSHWQKMTGLNQEQAAGLGWQGALHEEDVQSVEEAWANFVGGMEDFSQEYRFKRPTGDITWVSSTAVPFENESGQAIGYLGCVTDITPRKLFERELQVSRDDAHRANAAKSEFLSRMSHELRTPLNAVLGFSQLIQMNDNNLTVTQKEGIGHIYAGGEHLLELIEDVLGFSRIDTGHMSINLQQVSVNEILERSISMVSALAEQNSIKIILPEIPIPDVIADDRRVQQILINLLTNAIKYNRAGGFVAISAERIAGNRVRLNIKDSGIGIDPIDLSQIFEPFERGSNPENWVEGTGIGLSICRKLVELMGGEIGLTSDMGLGSTFWIDLAAANSSEDPDEGKLA